MIEIFRTNISKTTDARNMVLSLMSLYPTGKITFDLEDCDKVLRVETLRLKPDAIISLMQASGFACEILS
ncbi:hypothetical protein [Flavobacterium sp.]|uniref:hypothetical protein n=1 Tax=Flavobacterium sp. TaxID=239 RepID=UPI001203192E|nr:hypothetical protein [Flavobacterium sp.]RZJ69859.1 MAG: hypothetical protein EOO49_15620 [Flavobacterium sp.]